MQSSLHKSVGDEVGRLPDLKISRNPVLAGIAKICLTGMVVALAYYAIFRLPFRFPPTQRLCSTSYAFGFNNTVAVVALAVLLGLVAVLLGAGRRYSRRHLGWRPQFNIEPDVAGRRACVIALLIATGLYAVLTFVMYKYSVVSAPWLMWEVRHLLYRTWLMDICGLRPYIDFQAEYATASHLRSLVCLPGAQAARPIARTGLFCSSFSIECREVLVRVLPLSRVVMPARARLVTMGLLVVAGFAPYMGLDGVLLRYLCPFASLLAGHVVVARILSRPKRPSQLISLAIVVFPSLERKYSNFIGSRGCLRHRLALIRSVAATSRSKRFGNVAPRSGRLWIVELALAPVSLFQFAAQLLSRSRQPAFGAGAPLAFLYPDHVRGCASAPGREHSNIV